jgi:hypothetical protein
MVPMPPACVRCLSFACKFVARPLYMHACMHAGRPILISMYACGAPSLFCMRACSPSLPKAGLHAVMMGFAWVFLLAAEWHL